CQQLVEYPRTF
nr:immunoglobulin light chain junction region [Mus musculus]